MIDPREWADPRPGTERACKHDGALAWGGGGGARARQCTSCHGTRVAIKQTSRILHERFVNGKDTA